MQRPKDLTNEGMPEVQKILEDAELIGMAASDAVPGMLLFYYICTVLTSNIAEDVDDGADGADSGSSSGSDSE